MFQEIKNLNVQKERPISFICEDYRYQAKKLKGHSKVELLMTYQQDNKFLRVLF